MVEVQLDLVRGRTDRLITGELQLLDQVLMRVLRHPATLISIQEHVVDVQGRSHQGLVVRSRHLGSGEGAAAAVQVGHSPEALVNRAQIKVDLHLVVLERDQRQSQTGVTAVPELERDVQGRLRQGAARGAHLGRRAAGARAIHLREGRVGDVGQLGSVTHHLVVATLVAAQGQLVPDMHPVTILAVNALAANLDLHLGDQLLAGEVQPAREHAVHAILPGYRSVRHRLVNLGQGNLQVRAVRKITITADRARNAPAEVGLAIERLLDRLHREVSVTTVGHLPEGDLRVTGQVHVLRAVSDELHKSTTHSYTIAKEKKSWEKPL